MSQSLAIRYRPPTLDDVVEQSSTVRILKQQLQTGDLQHCYLFCGGTGSGKTSCAKAFSYEINGGVGQPLEIDAASNSGVDNVRALIKDAYERSITGQYKIIILDECVDGNTEILTSQGYVPFKDLTGTEKVAQYLEDGTIEFVAPEEFIKIPYRGPMYDVTLRNGKNHVLMSPHHVQPLWMNRSQKIRESYVEDCKFTQASKLLVGGLAQGTLQHLTTLDRLAIAVQADGHLHTHHVKDFSNRWQVALSSSAKVVRLKMLLDSCSIPYTEYKNLPSKPNNWHRFDFNLPGDITKKFSSRFKLEDMSYSYAREFIDEILCWDGSVKSGYPGYYSCVDKDNTDFVSAVVTLAGYSASQSVHTYTNSAHKPNHIVHWYYTDKRPSQAVSKTRVETFDDYIYCVKVPSHKIVVRAQGFTFITGNCHALSNAAWQAFLKCIEEPPAHTIFIFCTTDPQKLPATILNRMQKFNFTKISLDGIKSRLKFVCEQEGFTNYQEAIDYIARLANGCMRDALTMLDKCVDYSRDLAIQNVFEALGDFSYPDMFALINALIDGNEGEVLKRISTISDKGSDLKLFVDQFLTFTLDLAKYALFKNMELLQVPASFEEDVKNATNFEAPEKYYSYVVDKLLDLKNMIKGDSNITSTVEVIMLKIARCQ